MAQVMTKSTTTEDDIVHLGEDKARDRWPLHYRPEELHDLPARLPLLASVLAEESARLRHAHVALPKAPCYQVNTTKVRPERRPLLARDSRMSSLHASREANDVKCRR